MSFAQVWTILRWPLAIVGLLAIVAYALPRLPEAVGGMIEFDPSGSILAPAEEGTETEAPLEIPQAELVEPPLQPPTGPVEDGAAVPIADFAVEDTLADVDAEELPLTDDPGDAAVIAFEIPDGDPSCMAGVALDVTAIAVDSPTTVAVYPSTVEDPLGVVDDLQVGEDLRATPEPIATALIEAEGRVSFGMTAGYQQYFSLGYPEGTPLVLTVAAVPPVDAQGGVVLGALEGEAADAPALRWAGTPGCE